MMLGSRSRADAPALPQEADPVHGFPAYPVPTFQSIYKQYFDFVWSSARHLGVTLDVIDDVFQDVFMVIHAKLHTLQRPEALRSWIYGIVRRTVSDYRRSGRTREAARARLGVEFRSSQPSPHDLAERNAELKLLERVLAELDESKREVFVMVEVLEMAVPQVAQALEIPLNTAYSRLRVARQSFEEALASYEAHGKLKRRTCRA